MLVTGDDLIQAHGLVGGLTVFQTVRVAGRLLRDNPITIGVILNRVGGDIEVLPNQDIEGATEHPLSVLVRPVTYGVCGSVEDRSEHGVVGDGHVVLVDGSSDGSDLTSVDVDVELAEGGDYDLVVVSAPGAFVVCVPSVFGFGGILGVVVHIVVPESGDYDLVVLSADVTIVVCVPTGFFAGRLLGRHIHIVVAEGRERLVVGCGSEGRERCCVTEHSHILAGCCRVHAGSHGSSFLDDLTAPGALLVGGALLVVLRPDIGGLGPCMAESRNLGEGRLGEVLTAVDGHGSDAHLGSGRGTGGFLRPLGGDCGHASLDIAAAGTCRFVTSLLSVLAEGEDQAVIMTGLLHFDGLGVAEDLLSDVCERGVDNLSGLVAAVAHGGHGYPGIAGGGMGVVVGADCIILGSRVILSPGEGDVPLVA